ncbi:MAG: hypothetical protein JW830_07845 [Bacteroidales bacterium]|nr:hypothetical protein [Bacteroidales bacterium]
MKFANVLLSVSRAILLILTIQGCCTRHFTIQSDPRESMVIMGINSGLPGYSGEVCGLTPLNKTVTFLGKNDQYYFTVMKRGYQSDTIYCSKDSETNIHFNLVNIDSSFSNVTDDHKLQLADFYLLPVNTEVILHKGVGNLDKYVKSEELSREVTDSLDKMLESTIFPGKLHYISEDSFADTCNWKNHSDSIKSLLLALRPQLLPYYMKQPSIAEHDLKALSSATGHENLLEYKNFGTQYFVYIWCKSIKPTAGRVVGNIAAGIGSAVVQGYETAAYGVPVTVYDPQAFALDYSTLWMMFVFEKESGSVVKIKQYTMPFEITNPENLKKFASDLINIPQFINSQNDEI